MKTLTFSDICDIISNLDTTETDNYNKHMAMNPHDVQRKRDHITTNAAYCEMLHAMHDYIGGLER